MNRIVRDGIFFRRGKRSIRKYHETGRHRRSLKVRSSSGGWQKIFDSNAVLERPVSSILYRDTMIPANPVDRYYLREILSQHGSQNQLAVGINGHAFKRFYHVVVELVILGRVADEERSISNEKPSGRCDEHTARVHLRINDDPFVLDAVISKYIVYLYTY